MKAGVPSSVGLAMLLVGGQRLIGAGLLDWKTGLFFGCVIAATDPVAVTSIT